MIPRQIEAATTKEVNWGVFMGSIALKGRINIGIIKVASNRVLESKSRELEFGMCKL